MRGDADRFAGCLVGQALGDATGFIVEGAPAGECEAYVRTSARPRQLVGHSCGSFPFGQYTDDTQLARELAISLVECGGFDAAHYAQRIAVAFTTEGVVGRSRSMERTARRLAAGVPWELAAEPAPSAGDGSAMRAAPIGLFLFDDPDELIRAADEQSRITHADRRCSAGAIAIAGATAMAVRRGPLRADETCPILSAWTGDRDPVLAAALLDLPGWLRLSADDVYTRIAALDPMPRPDGFTGLPPFVTTCVLWSLHAALRTPDDYWEAICTALSVGGDVDTMAAMTGAIMGAALGSASIPRDLSARLNDRGEWRCEDLVRLGHRLHASHRRRNSSRPRF